MGTLLYVVIGLVALAAILLVAFRKRPEQLPEGEPERREPRLEAKRPAAAAPAPGPVLPPTTAAPIPLTSTDVLPASESIRVVPAAPPAPSAPPKRDVSAVRKGLAATRGGFIARLRGLFSGKKEIDPAILEQIEEVMLTSDVGVKTTHAIIERLREALSRNELRDADAVWAALRAEATRVLTVGGGDGPPDSAGGRVRLRSRPTVILMVGVNGVGKTTTIGKLATRYRGHDRSVLLGAGDTFRAAAVQQLEVWGKRVGADVVKGKDGADPGAVAYEATTKAKESGADVLLIDTAGRLHTKTPLMDEIKKVKKSIGKALEGAPHETLLVLDATIGQNALAQAALFKEAVDLTGIVLTKLDGTAKGGIVLGICDELKVPVRYIGLGERAEDLREFQPEDFVEALFGQSIEEAAAA